LARLAQRVGDEGARHLLLGRVGAESALERQADGELAPITPELLVALVFRSEERTAHLVGVAAAGLDFEAGTGDRTHHLVILGRFAGTGVETDAGAELLAYRPLLFDQRAQRGVVRIGRVLLEAEGGGDEIDLHP